MKGLAERRSQTSWCKARATAVCDVGAFLFSPHHRSTAQRPRPPTLGTQPFPTVHRGSSEGSQVQTKWPAMPHCCTLAIAHLRLHAWQKCAEEPDLGTFSLLCNCSSTPFLLAPSMDCKFRCPFIMCFRLRELPITLLPCSYKEASPSSCPLVVSIRRLLYPFLCDRMASSDVMWHSCE